MKKLMMLTSSGADFGKLKNIIKLIRDKDDIQLTLVACGTHLVYESGYSINEVEEKFKVNYKVHSSMNGNDHVCMSLSVSLLINHLASIIHNVKPDIAVIHGDRTEAFAFATVCSMMNIYTLHIEGGELSGTIDGKLRNCISVLANIHCVANKNAKQNLVKLGIEEQQIFITGCPGYDNILHVGADKQDGDMQILNRLLCKQDSIVISFHPDTVYPEDNIKFAELLIRIIKENPDLFFIIVLPNLDAGNKDIIHVFRVLEKEVSVTNYRRLTHIALEDYVVLLRNSRMMIGNSSTVVRETCLFGLPTINIGKRQLNRDHGENVISFPNCDYEKFDELFHRVLHMDRFEPEYVYGCKRTSASKEIVNIISKYSPNAEM